MTTACNPREWYRARPGFWFRPKLFGWGAVPVTWQGWAAALGFTLVSLSIALLGGARHNLLYLVLLVPLVVGFVWLCWVKTDGDWRWRWGKDA